MKQLNEGSNFGFLETPILIQKEIIDSLHFPKQDVLFSKEDIAKRELELRRANVLGNVSNIKVKIYFEDIEGLKKVETTIWGVTDKSVILKKNSIIPIHRIVRIYIV